MTMRKEFPQPLAEEVQRLLAAAPARTPIWQGTPAEARAGQARLLASRARGPRMASVEDLNIGHVPVRIYKPDTETQTIILYFHGGGWVMGGIDDSDAHVRRMAEATGCGIVSVGYRLAPEHPFPAAIQDAIAAWEWLVENAGAGVTLGIAGDSAGGNIAAGASIAIRDLGLAMPAFQILGYPVLSAVMDTPSYTGQADGPILSAADMRWFWDHYAPHAESRADPRASPLGAHDLSRLPPALIMAAACDPLRDEAALYAERLKEAGVPVRYRCYEGMIHGFYKMADVLEGGRMALAEAAIFVATQMVEMPYRQHHDAKSALD
jgi:acetyl esterase